jgi:hypothetical protein
LAEERLNHAQLLALIDGLDWTKVRPVVVKRPQTLRRIKSGALKGLGIGGDSVVMAAMTTPAAELPTTLAEAHALILALAAERRAIEAENSRIAEIATLTAANADLAAINQAADARIVELTAVVKMLDRTLYGAHSERLRSDRPAMSR